MIGRVLIAAVGALIVTAGLLLSMDAVTSLFRSQNGERFYRITDVLPKPERGRPERPAPARRQPEFERETFTGTDQEVPIEVPEALEPQPSTLPLPAIELPEPE